MKKFLFLILGFTLIFYACNNDPVEIDPTCTDGKQNGNETGIDCGGDCLPCFDCTTSFCSYLSGAVSTEPKTSIKWACTYVDDVPIDSSDKQWNIGPLELTYFSNGVFLQYHKGYQESENGFWSFDNPNEPTAIIHQYDDVTSSTETLVSLKEDEMKVMWGNSVVTWEPIF